MRAKTPRIDFRRVPAGRGVFICFCARRLLYFFQMGQRMKKIIKYLAIIFGVIAIDQLTKGILLYLILGRVPVFGSALNMIPFSYIMARVCDVFNIVFTWNPGASFSMFRNLGETAPLIIIFATAAVIGFVLYYLFRRGASGERTALALIAGGAIGNLIDRIRFGAVIDFLDFHIGAHHWPAFNVADICICVGVGLYLLNWFLAWRKKHYTKG